MANWLIGILCSGAVSLLAFRKGSLSGSGAVGAIVVGTVLYALGSTIWFATMIGFFVSSSLLTKWKHAAKAKVESTYEKSGRRDAGQVLANGGLASLLCIAHAVSPAAYWIWLYLGVMATVTADTWATEIGGLSRNQPYSIVTGKRVEAGTSGGVSLLGLFASALGGSFIGGIMWVASSVSGGSAEVPADIRYRLLVIGTFAGLCGSLADSFIGARWQRKNRCQTCGKELEASHHCGKPTFYARGKKWLGNDWVNLISSLIGGLISLGLFIIWK